MTQSFGQYLVNNIMDGAAQSGAPITKKILNKKLYDLTISDPGAAADKIDKLRELGHQLATTEGISISLDDITPDYKQRDAIMNPLLKKMQNTTDPAERRRLMMLEQPKLLAMAKDFQGSQGDLVRSGARGSATQLMRSFIAPVAARDAKGTPYPWLIHHSFGEGLRASEMFAATKESRNNQMSAYLNVVEPGDISKILVNNMNDQLILLEDCGTKNGIAMNADDPNINDRYLAQGAGRVKAGALITPQVASELAKHGGQVLVRSPMTCELNEGVCQKCYGHNEYGQAHALGTNIGVRSAQALSEPLTQFVLSAKHGTLQASAETKSKIEGLKGMRNMLDIPASFTNKATLSTVDGKVERIERAPQGGHNVFINGIPHYVHAHLEPMVHQKQQVYAGDALSDGIPKPDEVVQYKGMGEGRRYLVDRLHDTYKNQGIDIDKRHLELLARSHLNYAQIDHDPEQRFYPGEIVNYAGLMKSLGEDIKVVPTAKAAGLVLGTNHLHHLAGTTITPPMIAELKKNGYDHLEVALKAPKISFVMQPITTNPLLNPDWLARLGHRYMKNSIVEGAQFGDTTNIHGAHPVPAYSYGAEFGTGKNHKY